MPAEITRLDLRLRRRSVVAYSVGFAAYAVLIVALYPTFKNDTSLDQLTSDNATLSALFGVTGSLTSPVGWMNANLYANFVPVFTVLMAVGFGAAAIAGQDEDGTLGIWASQPVTRSRLLVEKVAALAALSLPVPLVTLAAALLGPRFELELDIAHLLGVTLGAALFGLDVGLVALAVGAWTGSRGAALGVASAYAAVAYVVSSLAPVISWIHDLRWVSLMWWSVGSDQLGAGLPATDLLVLVGTGLVLSVVAARGFAQLDLH